jgi:hypothetical protein
MESDFFCELEVTPLSKPTFAEAVEPLPFLGAILKSKSFFSNTDVTLCMAIRTSFESWMAVMPRHDVGGYVNAGDLDLPGWNKDSKTLT